MKENPVRTRSLLHSAGPMPTTGKPGRAGRGDRRAGVDEGESASSRLRRRALRGHLFLPMIGPPPSRRSSLPRLRRPISRFNASSLWATSSRTEERPGLGLPLYKSTYERRDGLKGDGQAPSLLARSRDRMVEGPGSHSRLPPTRKDIDSRRGLSRIQLGGRDGSSCSASRSGSRPPFSRPEASGSGMRCQKPTRSTSWRESGPGADGERPLDANSPWKLHNCRSSAAWEPRTRTRGSSFLDAGPGLRQGLHSRVTRLARQVPGTGKALRVSASLQNDTRAPRRTRRGLCQAVAFPNVGFVGSCRAGSGRLWPGVVGLIDSGRLLDVRQVEDVDDRDDRTAPNLNGYSTWRSTL